nr:uncharacterized protein LOC131800060 [Pocillopora verrucosa]
MKGHVLSIFVFCAVLATAYSLKCYSCSGSEEKCSKSKLEANKANMSVDCSDGECIRTWVKKDNHTVTIVDNFCSSTCEEIKKACDAFKDGKCAVGCCDSDYCNAGSVYSSSVILMIVTSALGLALLN